MPVNPNTLDTVNLLSLNIPMMSSHSFALAMSNATAHAQAMGLLSTACTGAIVKRLVELDVNEAAGMVPLVQQLMKAGAPGMPE